MVGDPADPQRAFTGMSDGTVWTTDDGGESFRHVELEGLPAVVSIAVAR
jgi:photosystem II stability/assembly factor-like uncharacterized protein